VEGASPSGQARTWFFLGDAHLSAADPGRQRRLMAFLEEHAGEMQGLVILGDLFEFWFGFPGYVDPAYVPLCRVLEVLARRGVRLIYVEGNHDFCMGPFFTETLGAEVAAGGRWLELDGRRLFVAHGDGLDPRDVRYRVYRRILKNPVTYALIRRLGPARVGRIRQGLQRRSWMHRRLDMGTEPPAEEQFARRMVDRGADAVILAHTHRPVEKVFVSRERTGYYLNVGDWIDYCSYVRYDARQGFRLGYHRTEDPI